MIDLHCHILPGMDDGAKDMEQAVRMAELAVRDGIHTIVATPHYQSEGFKCERDLIRKKVEEFNQELQQREIPLTVLPGMEPHIRVDFLDQLQKGELLTLDPIEKYVFVELPFRQQPPNLEQFFFQILLAGYVPIIPHPERTVYFQERPVLLYQLVKQGVLTQVNAGSLTGLFGKKVQRYTREIVESGLLHLIATDAHDDRRRSPKLSEAYDEIARIAGKEFALDLQQNAEAVIQGKDFFVEEPMKPQRKWFRLFG